MKKFGVGLSIVLACSVDSKDDRKFGSGDAGAAGIGTGGNAINGGRGGSSGADQAARVTRGSVVLRAAGSAVR